MVSVAQEIRWRWGRAKRTGGIWGAVMRAVRGAPPPPPRQRGSGGARAVSVNGRPVMDDAWVDEMERLLRRGGVPTREGTAELVRSATWSPELTQARDIDGVVMGPRARRMAARKAVADRRVFYAPFYTNPRQSVMYHVIEAVSTQTFCHTVIGILMALIMGTGIRPEIYLKKPTDDAEKDAAELEKHKWIEDVLKAMDHRVGPSDESRVGRTSFFDQVQTLVRCALVYNRGALLLHPAVGPLEVDGTLYNNLPGSLQFVHARDLETIKVDELGDLVSVSWTAGGREIAWEDMIYLWNSLGGEEQRMTRWYGRSLIDGCLGTLRSVFQVVMVDIPACAKATYAGHVIIPYNVAMLDDEQKERELAAVSNAVVPGGVSVVAAHPEDLDVKPVAVTAKMTELIEYLNFAYREVCSAFRIPQSVVFDEAASNRATMTGKLIYTTRGMVRTIREWIDREVGAQWYGAALKTVLDQAEVKDAEAIYEKIGVRLAFDELSLEGDEKKIEQLAALVRMVPIKDKAILEKAGFPELINEIDEDKRERMEEMGIGPGMPDDVGGSDPGEPKRLDGDDDG